MDCKASSHSTHINTVMFLFNQCVYNASLHPNWISLPSPERTRGPSKRFSMRRLRQIMAFSFAGLLILAARRGRTLVVLPSRVAEATKTPCCDPFRKSGSALQHCLDLLGSSKRSGSIVALVESVEDGVPDDPCRFTPFFAISDTRFRRFVGHPISPMTSTARLMESHLAESDRGPFDRFLQGSE